MTTLTPHLAKLEAAWNEGCHSGAALWRMLRAEGFRGSLRVVTEWATRRRRSKQDSALPLRKPPQSRHIGRLMLAEPARLSRADALTIAAITAAVPALATARDLVGQFHHMLRTGGAAALPAWIDAVCGSSLAALGRGIGADFAAVAAALEQPWSNGPTEGSITRLKLLRRQLIPYRCCCHRAALLPFSGSPSAPVGDEPNGRDASKAPSLDPSRGSIGKGGQHATRTPSHCSLRYRIDPDWRCRRVATRDRAGLGGTRSRPGCRGPDPGNARSEPRGA